MTRVFITGSADGLGRAAAQTLLEHGHEVVVHARNTSRLTAVRELQDRGAVAVIGDLSDLEETRGVADQVNRLGPMDAVIHNAGVLTGPQVLAVNVVAPYLLTALIHRPKRLVYLSSGMHRGGRASLTGMEWSSDRATGSYSDSKLFVTTLAIAVARRWTDVFSNAVDPSWVPTKMGGAGAPDDLRLGHLTQEWLATSDDPEARTSGGYWHHQRRANQVASGAPKSPTGGQMRRVEVTRARSSISSSWKRSSWMLRAGSGIDQPLDQLLSPPNRLAQHHARLRTTVHP